MGSWKWPSLLLLAYCLVLIVPYAYTGGGGSNGLRADVTEISLHGCPFQIDARRDEASLNVRARLAPSCAFGQSIPNVALIRVDGDVLAETALRGHPNNLRARLSAPDSSDAGALRLAFTSDALNGETDRAEIPAPPAPTQD